MSGLEVQGDQSTVFPAWDWPSTVVGVRWDNATGIVGITTDGTNFTEANVNTATSSTPDINQIAWGMAVHQGNNNTMSINFGQQPFVHPIPNGFVRAQTQNMPEATITNGRDHFQAITGPGSGGFLLFPEGTFQTLDGKQTEPLDTSGPSFFTPVTTGLSRQSYVLDAFIETASITFSVAPGWATNGPAEFYTSTDGINWTREPDVASFPDGPQTLNATNPSRFWRFFWPSNAPNFGNFTSTNAPILELARTTFDNGLWWIKSRVSDGNTNQHQFVDSVRGATVAFNCPGDPGNGGRETNYTAPAGSSVAWCWNLLADRSNGFDIVEFTGTGNDLNVPHNLGEIPEFIITARRNTGVDQHRPVYHTSLDTTRTMFLDLNSTGSTNTSPHYRQTPTATEFFVGGATNINASGEQMISYLWRSVPGYSAFGSYTGNGDPNGPFIYTGMKVAWVMVKNTGTGSTHWRIYDSTRKPDNPNNLILNANLTEEDFVSANPFDFLSNGFKIRGNDASTNSTGNNYVYCAFSENPFGGNNVSPANAR